MSERNRKHSTESMDDILARLNKNLGIEDDAADTSAETETSAPTKQEVIESMDARLSQARINLNLLKKDRSKVKSNVARGNLDTEISLAQQELESLEAEWERYGGDKVDEARARVKAADAKTGALRDANDKLAPRALAEAEDKFYANFMNDYNRVNDDEDVPTMPPLKDEEEDVPTMPPLEDEEDVPMMPPLGAETDEDGKDLPTTEPATTPETADAADTTEPEPTESETPEVKAKREALEQAAATLDAARAAWAAMTTKRQSRAFNYKAIHGYNKAKEDYETIVRDYGKMVLAEQLAGAENETQKNAIAIDYYIEEQNKLRELVRHESDNKVINKLSNWMNKGSRKARLAKGVAIGAVFAGGGALLGVAGAGVALAAGAAGAGRFVRGYTQRHLSGMEKLDVNALAEKTQGEYGDAPADTTESKMDRMSNIFANYFEEDAKKEQNRRKKALAWGVGSVAVGAGVGQLLAHAPGVSGAAEHARNWVGDKVGGVKDHFFGGDHSPSGNGVDTNAQGNDLPRNGNPPVDKPGVGDVAPPADPPALTPEQLARVHDFMNIHAGEGGYETLREIGVPAGLRDDIWADASSKLKDVYFVGNEARWSHAGPMSAHNTQVLADSAAKFGIDINTLLGK